MSDTEHVDQYERKRQVLKAALERAQKGGFKLTNDHYVARDKYTGNILGWESWAFSPEFAQAFWGSQPYRMGEYKGQHSNDDSLKGFFGISEWQYKQWQMVWAQDRIEFLAKELGL